MSTPKTPPKLPLLFLLSLACFLPFPSHSQTQEKNETKIQGMFVFGSSLVDNGNNNFLMNSLAKADYLPYGIDFPLGPSGRFTNGKNVIDLLGDHLMIPSYIPVFNDPSTKGNRIIHGVNYASGASGILDDTGSLAGNVMSLSKQIRNFEEMTLPELEVQLGRSSRESLPKYLFVVGTGGNDYSFNYFLTGANNNISLEAFTSNLITSLTIQLKKLYGLGARKFVLMSINPNGCSPAVRANRPMKKGCVQDQNRAFHLFNTYLKSLVDVVKPKMPESNLVFVNSYKVIRDILNSPASKGFIETRNTCCEVTSINEGGNGVLCNKGGSTCANRSIHVYYDGLHPTEAVNVLIAKKAFTSNMKAEVYPINVEQLSLV